MENHETVDETKVKEIIEWVLDLFDDNKVDPITALCALKVMSQTIESDLAAQGVRVNVAMLEKTGETN